MIISEVLPVIDNRITNQWMRCLETFIGSDGNKFAINLEQSIEEDIIKMLQELDIKASVKPDRYSLPVHGSVTSKSSFSSYIPDIYDSSEVKRNFLKIILNKGCRKVRFYVYIYTNELEGEKGFRAMLGKKFIIEIRYYLHD